MKTILEVLGESSVRAIIIALMTGCVLRALRVKSPGICHHAWTGVLLAMLCLPLLSTWSHRIVIRALPALSVPTTEKPLSLIAETWQAAVPDISTTESAPQDAPLLPKRSTKSEITNQSTIHLNIYQMAGIVYLTGFFVLALKLLAGTLLSRRLTRGATRDGSIIYTNRCTVPMTVGLYKALVFLPSESKHWDPDKLDAVLIHEKEHLRRRDPLIEWLAVLNRSLYWFNPLAWWLCSKLSGQAEQACDDAVLAKGHDGNTYTEHLLDFARSVRKSGALIALRGSSLHGSKLAQRVRRILNSRKAQTISPFRLTILAALCGIAIVVPSIFELARAQGSPFHTPVITLPATTPAPSYGAVGNHQLNQPAPSQVKPKPDLSKTPDQDLKTGQHKQARMAFQNPIDTPKAQADTQTTGTPNGSGTNPRAFNYTAPFYEGYNLSPEQVTELENTVEKNPDNLEAQSRLLSYYYTHSANDKTLRPKQERLVLWLIQNHPDSKILGDLHGKLLPKINNYAEGERLWNSQLQKYPDNVKVISNACGYFQVGNIDLAIQCYKHGKSIDPENASEWDRKLGASYNAKMVNSPADQQPLWAKESLSAYESAYAESKPKTFSYNAGGSARTVAFPDMLKSSLVPIMAKAALAAGDLDKAVKYANQMLETAGERENSLQKGDYIYTGNSILGLISVQKGDLDSADKYLLKAGETPGSAGLKILPDMSLAKVLLSRGHRDTVLAFLKECQKFSDSSLSHVGQWIQEMEAGKTPDFDQMRHELEQRINEL